MIRMPSACLFVLLLACKLWAADEVIRLSGEVTRGNEYRHLIGHGLLFVLGPTDSGWMIRVVPETKCTDHDDWASVVNAPFRNYNALYVDASYGITAAQAVKEMNPRIFSFVLTCEDYKAEASRLNAVLWPPNYSESAAKAALAELGSSPQGKAKFTILDSKVDSSVKSNGNNVGIIEWLKFQLDVTFAFAAPVRSPRPPTPDKQN